MPLRYSRTQNWWFKIASCVWLRTKITASSKIKEEVTIVKHRRQVPLFFSIVHIILICLQMFRFFFRSGNPVVADFGCGEARLARAVSSCCEKVYSFDLVATNELVRSKFRQLLKPSSTLNFYTFTFHPKFFQTTKCELLLQSVLLIIQVYSKICTEAVLKPV